MSRRWMSKTFSPPALNRARSGTRRPKRLSLPPLIASPEDVWAFEWPEAAPNYITQKQVTAPVVECTRREALGRRDRLHSERRSWL